LDVREEVRRLATSLAEEDGFELVDVELLVQGRRRTLRVLLDRPGGIQVGECARFSRRLSDCLDMNQTMPGAYDLEVSSPGIQRPLRTLESVVRFAGQRVSLTTHEPRDGRRRWEGELLAPVDGRVGLRTDEAVEQWFEWADVRDAHLVVDPWARVRGEGETR
jgi:ribosome maturation factor RimP